ncbi:MAG: hypothetical protein P4L36_05135 [Holophaga sp.]|nr:hypothetical protein [Holophaga sp.]
MAWLKVTITPEDVAQGRHTHLQEKFQAVTMRMRGAKGVAMFGPSDPAGPYVCYFTPACAPLVGDFLKTRGAVECEAPLRSEVRLLAGDAEATALTLESRP